jgi:hypothetical protein
MLMSEHAEVRVVAWIDLVTASGVRRLSCNGVLPSHPLLLVGPTRS